MGFWTNNPSSAPKAKKPKSEPKPAKTERKQRSRAGAKRAAIKNDEEAA